MTLRLSVFRRNGTCCQMVPVARTLATIVQRIGGPPKAERCVIRRKCLPTVIKRQASHRHHSEYIVKSPYPELPIPKVPITEYVWSNVEKWPDRTAIECAVTGRSYKFAELRDLSARFANSLLRIGFKPGDILAVVLPNLPEYPIVLLGAIEAGIVVTPLNPIYTEDEMTRQIDNCGAIGVVTTLQYLPKIQSMMKRARSCQYGFVIGDAPQGFIDFHQFVQEGSTRKIYNSNFNIEDTIILPYSSGTTGLPKGVELTQRTIVTNFCQFQTPQVCVLRENYQEVILGVLPFFHIYGLTTSLINITLGNKTVTLPGFETTSFLKCLSEHSITIFYLVPPLIQVLGGSPDVKPEMLKSSHNVLCGAAPVARADIEKFLDRANKDTVFQQAYGMTELSPLATMGDPTPGFDVMCNGSPIFSTSLKIIDLETNESKGINETGELCVLGPQIMKGYYKNPQATAETIDKDGWLHTGDIAYFNEDNCIYVIDRRKELIKVKGFQVAPAELEELLKSHPKVSDAAVVGVLDEKSGEVPRAFVVPRAEGVSEKEVQRFIEERVAPYKKLAGGVVLLDNIPKSPSGKILRRLLKEQQ